MEQTPVSIKFAAGRLKQLGLCVLSGQRQSLHDSSENSPLRRP
jgi:hypothetical protein